MINIILMFFLAILFLILATGCYIMNEEYPEVSTFIVSMGLLFANGYLMWILVKGLQ